MLPDQPRSSLLSTSDDSYIKCQETSSFRHFLFFTRVLFLSLKEWMSQYRNNKGDLRTAKQKATPTYLLDKELERRSLQGRASRTPLTASKLGTVGTVALFSTNIPAVVSYDFLPELSHPPTYTYTLLGGVLCYVKPRGIDGLWRRLELSLFFFLLFFMPFVAWRYHNLCSWAWVGRITPSSSRGPDSHGC